MMESATGDNLHKLQGDKILQNIQMYRPIVDEEGKKELQERIRLKASSKEVLAGTEDVPQTARNSTHQAHFKTINQQSAKSLSMTPVHSRLEHGKQSISRLSKP